MFATRELLGRDRVPAVEVPIDGPVMITRASSLNDTKAPIWRSVLRMLTRAVERPSAPSEEYLPPVSRPGRLLRLPSHT